MPVEYAITRDREEGVVKVFVPIDGTWDVTYESPKPSL
jgi:hypothetical protein